MNGSVEVAKALIADVINGISQNQLVLQSCEFVLCPPYLYFYALRHNLRTIDFIKLGAQDCSRFDNGAHTGDISAQMLNDSGCEYVILGHSERRQYHGESDSYISQKAAQAHANGLTTIICVGETESQREQGMEQEVVAGQLENSLPDSTRFDNVVIAYEPVWAIGTGKVAQVEDVATMHEFIRGKLGQRYEGAGNIRILYGGSMKPDNAGELLSTPNVDGGLIGGASLIADEFVGIAKTI